MDEGEEVRRGFRVEGRVQGVGFRAWVARRGRELALVGYVRNLEDGSVEVQASGPAGALEVLSRELGTGPALARVDRVRVVDPDRTMEEQSFVVRR